jgi:hypothetical protein
MGASFVDPGSAKASFVQALLATRFLRPEFIRDMSKPSF